MTQKKKRVRKKRDPKHYRLKQKAQLAHREQLLRGKYGTSDGHYADVGSGLHGAGKIKEQYEKFPEQLANNTRRNRIARARRGTISGCKKFAA